MNTKRGFAQINILIIIIILVVVVGGGYMLLQKSKKISVSNTTGAQQVIRDEVAKDEAELNSVDVDASIGSGLNQIDSDVATF